MTHADSASGPSRRPHLADGVLQTDLCVIGAGSAGLSVAAGAVQMGASVVLIERARMGGDCLNTGCVPSKALLAAAHAAHAMQSAGRFGVRPQVPQVDFAATHAHVHGVIAAIAPHDSVERFQGLGVHVIQAAARFLDHATVEAAGQRIRARRFVIATGSRAALPPIPGLPDVPHMTNESLFDLTRLPDHLAVIGGGAIGIEMAQAFRRLGSRVTVIERASILPRDEPECVAVVRAALAAEGIEIIERAAIDRVARDGDGIVVHLPDRAITASHLLVAAGRAPNIEELGLDAAGIANTPRGITVDAGLVTGNRRVFAIGDVAGGPQFTHVAGQHAGIVIRRALFGLPARADYRALPWVTYADPELAQVGQTEAAARESGGRVRVLSQVFAGNDRAQAERETNGLIKLVLDHRGHVLGASIVGSHAGELIGMWALAVARRIKVGHVASLVLPYPTLSEIGKRAAGGWYTPTLFGARTRRIVGLIQRVLP
jgi:pyruvate/2-oxoglutarate dehydrogenase complex dihydrolipoamide dehydrogenase (E3) component